MFMSTDIGRKMKGEEQIGKLCASVELVSVHSGAVECATSNSPRDHIELLARDQLSRRHYIGGTLVYFMYKRF